MIGSTITGIRMSNYSPSSMSFFYPLPTAGLCALPKFTSIKTSLHGRSVLATKAASNMSINFFCDSCGQRIDWFGLDDAKEVYIGWSGPKDDEKDDEVD